MLRAALLRIELINEVDLDWGRGSGETKNQENN